MQNFNTTGVTAVLATILAIPAAVIGWQAGHTNTEALMLASCTALLASVYVILCLRGANLSA